MDGDKFQLTGRQKKRQIMLVFDHGLPPRTLLTAVCNGVKVAGRIVAVAC